MAPRVPVQRLDGLLAGLAEAPPLPVGEPSIDSRGVVNGGVFLACQGGQVHGLDFLGQALARGAAAVLWEPVPGRQAPRAEVPVIAVERLSRHAGEIAARFYGHPSAAMRCVGITGTDGKTSTAWLLAHAQEALGWPTLYLGTLGAGKPGALRPGDHTTPDAVRLQRTLRQALDAGAVAVAMEVSSHALDQARTGGMQFHTAVLTNVGRDHLDYHGSVERYAAAKRRLFTDYPLQAALLNRDDAHGAAWLRDLAGRVPCIPYGLDGDVPGGRFVIGRRVELTAAGVAFEATTHAGPARIASRLLGRFNAYNLLAALAALLEGGAALADAAGALAAVPTVPGRIEGFRGPRAAPLVVVDYAHTPQALAQVLAAARAHCSGALWCVFGCGGDRDRGKRPLMAAAAAQGADHVIVTDDNPRYEDPVAIVQDIQSGFPAGFAAQVIHDRADAIEVAVRSAAAADVVVVAGKGHEDYQIHGNERRRFSDRAFVAELVG